MFLDYNLLEDVKRIAESAQRKRVKLCGDYHFRLPFPLKSLRSAAINRRTRILFHSNGMSKREMNKTYYNNRYLQSNGAVGYMLFCCGIFWFILVFVQV